jgi:hypothetical protein
MDLVRELTDVGPGATWTARDDNPRLNFGAILGLPGSEEAPLAWARLLVPEEMTHRYGRDSRCAYLVLYVEPRSSTGATAPAASLVSWHQRLVGALKLPTALAEFLTERLELSTSDDPAAEVAVWLKAPQALTELVEVDGFESVPGSTPSSWFMGFAVASPDGQPLAGVAQAWLRQICDAALHLDGYESALASLGAALPGGQPRLVVTVLYDVAWDIWQELAYIAAAEIGITNTTDVAIRIRSTGVGSDWGRNPPGGLPMLDAAQSAALQQEIVGRP